MQNDYKHRHLSTTQALKEYQLEKARNNGFVDLEVLDCGHWKVKVYRTEIEKEAFLLSKLSDMLRRFLSPFAG
jgi:hypothetical protein